MRDGPRDDETLPVAIYRGNFCNVPARPGEHFLGRAIRTGGFSGDVGGKLSARARAETMPR